MDVPDASDEPTLVQTKVSDSLETFPIDSLWQTEHVHISRRAYISDASLKEYS